MDSGATITIRSYAKRYGTDRYTAYADLKAIGVPLTEADKRWAVRPASITGRKKPAPITGTEQDTRPPWDWCFDGYQVMLIIGHTRGGAPYGPTESQAQRGVPAPGQLLTAARAKATPASFGDPAP